MPSCQSLLYLVESFYGPVVRKMCVEKHQKVQWCSYSPSKYFVRRTGRSRHEYGHQLGCGQASDQEPGDVEEYVRVDRMERTAENEYHTVAR